MSKQNPRRRRAFIAALAELLNRRADRAEREAEYGEDDSLEVRVVKTPPQVVQMAAPQMAYAPAPHPQAPAVAAAPAARQRPPRWRTRAASGAVTSPMVGTVYLSPNRARSPLRPSVRR